MDKSRTINLNYLEYSNLMRTKDRYELLVDALFRSARLGYDGNTLSFDTGVIDLLMKTFESGSYEKVLKQFKEEQEVVLIQLLSNSIKEKEDE